MQPQTTNSSDVSLKVFFSVMSVCWRDVPLCIFLNEILYMYIYLHILLFFPLIVCHEHLYMSVYTLM